MESLPIIILSPHADDIALSLGGWLASRRRLEPALLKRVEAYTAFMWSSGLPHIPEFKGNAVKATELRTAEDRAYFDRFGMAVSIGMLPDTSILNINYLDPIDIRSDQRLLLLRDRLMPKIDQRIVFAPISLGNHIDHRILAQIAIGSSTAKLVAFYEDIPYATWYSLNERTNQVREKLGPDVTPFDCVLSTEDWSEKAKNLAIYRSQLDKSEIETVLAYRANGGDQLIERLWLINPAADDVKQLAKLGFNKAWGT